MTGVTTQAYDQKDLLERVAFDYVMGTLQKSGSHGSNIARASSRDWQTKMVRAAKGVITVTSEAELHKALETQDPHLIFVPRDSGLNRAVIDQACVKSAFHKTIILEVE